MNFTSFEDEGQELEVLKRGLPLFLTFDLSKHSAFSLSRQLNDELTYVNQHDYLLTKFLLEDIARQYAESEHLKVRALMKSWILGSVENIDLIIQFARTVRWLVQDDYQTTSPEHLTYLVSKTCYDALFFHWFKDSTLLGLVNYTDLAHLVTSGMEDVNALIGLADYRAGTIPPAESITVVPTIRPYDLAVIGMDVARLKHLGMLAPFINSANIPPLFQDNPYLSRAGVKYGHTFRLEIPALETEEQQRYLMGLKVSLVTGQLLPPPIQRFPLTLAAKFAYPDFTQSPITVCRSLQSYIIIQKQAQPSSCRLQI